MIGYSINMKNTKKPLLGIFLFVLSAPVIGARPALAQIAAERAVESATPRALEPLSLPTPQDFSISNEAPLEGIPETPTLGIPRSDATLQTQETPLEQTAHPALKSESQAISPQSVEPVASKLAPMAIKKRALSRTTGKLSKISASISNSFQTDALAQFIDGAKPYPTVDDREARAFSHELEDSPRQIKNAGVKAVVTVFGSARTLPKEEALARYKKAAAAAKLNSQDEAARESLSRAKQDLKMSRYYEEARKFGEIVARKSQGTLAVATGGGPGIMEAANKGALKAGGPSIGHSIKLPNEQTSNPYLTPGLDFLYDNFAPRKINLRRGAAALAFFPGGFGTMDELFETLTLMQTGKIPTVPIALVGKNYWNKILNFDSFAQMGVISKKDLSLFKIVDNAEEAWAFLFAKPMK